jgi:hypothetical protein
LQLFCNSPFFPHQRRGKIDLYRVIVAITNHPNNGNNPKRPPEEKHE